MIEIKGLSYFAGRKKILSKVSLFADDGEITVILGRNGSGKTTLFRSIFLTRGAADGEKILIDGIPMTAVSARERSQRLALMPQELPTPEISVRELVSLGRTPYSGTFGKLSRKDREAVDAALERLGIASLVDSSVATLSGGERRSAFFAMLLAKDAPNVLLDEPASSLDVPCRSRLFSLANDLRDEGKCVIMIMHDLTDAVSVADKIYVMEGGTCSHPMTPDEFCTSGIPERLFASSAYALKTERGEQTVFRPIE